VVAGALPVLPVGAGSADPNAGGLETVAVAVAAAYVGEAAVGFVASAVGTALAAFAVHLPAIARA